ncbi:hypothetical protein COCMIDRAFT_97131, partial [Bipolaris oryzae ATCC 44560]
SPSRIPSNPPPPTPLPPIPIPIPTPIPPSTNPPHPSLDNLVNPIRQIRLPLPPFLTQ